MDLEKLYEYDKEARKVIRYLLKKKFLIRQYPYKSFKTRKNLGINNFFTKLACNSQYYSSPKVLV